MPQPNDIATNAANAASDRFYVQRINAAEGALSQSEIQRIRRENSTADEYLEALEAAAEESRAA